MKKDLQTIEKEIKGVTLEYTKITELPSYFRFYQFKEVYVRGLNLLESEALSKYIDDTKDVDKNLEDLVRIYKDVILIENGSIEDLEVIDFLTLCMFSSTLTMDDFAGAYTNIECQNMVPNIKREEILFKIEEKKKQLKDIENKEDLDKLAEEIAELELQYKNEEPYVKCGTKIQSPITLFDFDFNEPIVKDFEEIEFKNQKLKLGPLTVKDVIEIEKFKDLNDLSESQIRALYLSALIKNLNKSLEEKMNYILYSPVSLSKKIMEWEEKLVIDNKPIIKVCPKCGHNNKVYVGLLDIKVYP